MVLLGLVGSVGSAGHVKADTLWSTNATGNARQFEMTCSTCPNPVTELSNLSDGGRGNTLATVSFSNGALVSYFAESVFTGPKSLPHLRASATGDVEIVAPSTFFFAASGIARATQQYTYTGTTSTDYTIEYNVDGSLAGGILSEIAGGFTVFGKGFKPNQEIEPVLGFTFDHANGDTTEKPVHLTGTVTFPVNPGDDVFVQATLEAIVDSRSLALFGSADASHTLDMSFTQGDTSLLIPAATTPSAGVPEPANIVLTTFGSAVLLLGAWRRKRR